MKRDYYEILGVGRSATNKEIKKAFRVLAHKHHPDKNNGEATERYTNVQTAYKILSSPGQKAFYDEHGFGDEDKEFIGVKNLASQMTAHIILKEGIAPELVANEMERQARHNIDRGEQEVDGLASKINDLKKSQEALKAKDDLSYDLLFDAIQQNINSIQGQVMAASNTLKTYKLLLDFVLKYEKGEEGVRMNFNLGSTHTGTNWP